MVELILLPFSLEVVNVDRHSSEGWREKPEDWRLRDEDQAAVQREGFSCCCRHQGRKLISEVTNELSLRRWIAGSIGRTSCESGGSDRGWLRYQGGVLIEPKPGGEQYLRSNKMKLGGIPWCNLLDNTGQEAGAGSQR